MPKSDIKIQCEILTDPPQIKNSFITDVVKKSPKCENISTQTDENGSEEEDLEKHMGDLYQKYFKQSKVMKKLKAENEKLKLENKKVRKLQDQLDQISTYQPILE